MSTAMHAELTPARVSEPVGGWHDRRRAARVATRCVHADRRGPHAFQSAPPRVVATPRIELATRPHLGPGPCRCGCGTAVERVGQRQRRRDPGLDRRRIGHPPRSRALTPRAPHRASDWRPCVPLLTLHSIAGEACAGASVALTSSDGEGELVWACQPPRTPSAAAVVAGFALVPEVVAVHRAACTADRPAQPSGRARMPAGSHSSSRSERSPNTRVARAASHPKNDKKEVAGCPYSTARGAG